MSSEDNKPVETAHRTDGGEAAQSEAPPAGNGEPTVYHEQTTDNTKAYDAYHDDYGYAESQAEVVSTTLTETNPAALPAEPPPPSPPPPSTPSEDDSGEDEGMLRMSFLEHLEELRARIVGSLAGMGIAFLCCIVFSERIWKALYRPAVEALKQAGATDPRLFMTTPTEAFSIIWVKIPVLASLFIASPWILYQVWAFIAPGLYKHERQWAAPFVISAASLFVIGGVFAYYVAFPLGLAFLLGIGTSSELGTVITITEYFDLFFNVTLGMGVVFELPVLIFFLSLLRIVTPAFLVRNSRYAILAIVVVAALITPTPDVINLMLISVPMIVLYFSGVLASYLLWLSREKRRFPWLLVLLAIAATAAVAASFVYAAVRVYGFRLVNYWPYLVK
jgi:sec-independent protein translocase protein TatC